MSCFVRCCVTISPDDGISLLGNTNVRIFVDGRPYPAFDIRYGNCKLLKTFGKH